MAELAEHLDSLSSIVQQQREVALAPHRPCAAGETLGGTWNDVD
jgi:hypothetical protein